jgi:alkanesulfonate monooxygenase SsuD/methylene tetrahydromethanopterin reductase-like flavin-dependent oxidoreductase (luciferase family)
LDHYKNNQGEKIYMPAHEPLIPRFGASIDPSTGNLEQAFRLAQLADNNELDLLTSQDHPYNRNHLDTWTLLSALAMRTEQVHLGTNVANLPLRPPVMLAKAAATLDLLSGGRFEMGLGAGFNWPGVQAMGGSKRSPGEAVTAFEEALQILRGFWDNADGTLKFEGEFYHASGARPGPAPAHRIPIWTGAYGPRMLDLTGRLADGTLFTSNYLAPEGLDEANRRIDQGAQKAGRSESEVRRGYNIMGVIGADSPDAAGWIEGQLRGDVSAWVRELERLYREQRMDTFIFWPIGGEEERQVEVFAREIVPQVKDLIRSARRPPGR